MDEDNDSQHSRRSYVASLPSDYSDVQPRSYDPDFISSISNQMQVPESIPVLNSNESDLSLLRNDAWQSTSNRNKMNVPEKIILAGGGEHIGAKADLPKLNFDNMPISTAPESVGLMTPPRTLTVEEQFPSVHQDEDDDNINNSNSKIPNGAMAGHQGGMSAFNRSDSVQMTEEESNQLRFQLIRLNKRLMALEREQEATGNRERAMVGAAFGYFMLKFMFWFFRGK